MSEHVYLISMATVFGTILLVFGMKYFAAVREARSRATSDAAYRELAKNVAATQSENAKSLFSIQSQLVEIKIPCVPTSTGNSRIFVFAH